MNERLPNTSGANVLSSRKKTQKNLVKGGGGGGGGGGDGIQPPSPVSSYVRGLKFTRICIKNHGTLTGGDSFPIQILVIFWKKWRLKISSTDYLIECNMHLCFFGSGWSRD